MAKKSKAKKSKNLVQVVCDLLTVVLGGLLLGFIALPHVKLEISSGFLGTSSSSTIDGYSLINFEEGANVGLSVVLLLAIIFAGLMVLSGLLKLACDTGVVKGDVVGVLFENSYSQKKLPYFTSFSY